MHALYLVCFIVGLLLSLVLTLLGGLHLDTSGHGHVEASGHHAEWASDLVGTLLGLLSPIALAGGALVFGGVGLILGSSAFALPVALVAGLLAVALLRALIAALRSSSTPPLQLTAEGAIGTVNATIRPDAPGEVVYTLEGLHRSVAARSVDDTIIPRGTQVVITQREGGVAWVQPLNPLDEFPERRQE